MTRRVLVVASLGTGGVSTLMTNIQNRLNREQLNFDYLVFHDTRPYRADFVEKLGSRIYKASVDGLKFRPLRRVARLYEIYKVCKKSRIEYLHYNADIPADLTNILAAKFAGVKHITMHAHNASYTASGLSVKFMSAICKPLLYGKCDAYWACSDLAGRFVYPNRVFNSDKYKMVPNGIDISKFDYDERTRAKVREDLDIEGKFVIGHAGRFVEQKNHKFLIDIFKELKSRDADCEFLLYGTGELEEDIKQYADKVGVSVRFMGVSSEMNKIWQGIDVMVMPSLHEGLPVSGIEAQASGLQCVFADSITREVDVSGNSAFLSLNQSPAVWAEEILKYKKYNRHSNRDILLEKQYDISQMTEFFQNYYLSLK